MASGSLRRFDVQAKISVILSSISFVGMLSLAGLLFRNLNFDLRIIPYGQATIYGPVVLGLTAVTMLLAAVGVLFGYSSAGQRRNEHQARSWLGFFMGAGVLSVCIILFAMFFRYRMPM